MARIMRDGVCALGLLCLLCGCGAARRVTLGTIERQVPVAAPLHEVRASVPAGTLAVRGGAAGSVRVVCEVAVREPRAAEFVGPPSFDDHLIVEQDAGALVVRSAHEGQADAEDWELRLELEVPGEPALQASVQVGTLAVSLPRLATLRAEVGTGKLSVETQQITGAIDAEIGVGPLRVAITGAAPGGDVRLRAGTGDVELRLPDGASGRFALRTDVGRVTVAERYGLAVQRQVSQARAEGLVGDGGPRYDLSVGVGSVRLH